MQQQKNPYRTKLSTVVHFMHGSLRYFIGAAVLIVAASVTEMLTPRIVSFTVDSVIGDKITDLSAAINTVFSRDYLRSHLWLTALAVVAVAALSVGARCLYRVLNAKGGETLVERMRNLFFEHILHMPFSALSGNMTGELIQKGTSDINLVKRFISDQLITVLRVAVMLCLSFFFMFSMHAQLSMVAAVAVPLILGYSLIFRVFITKKFRVCDEQESTLSTIAQENLVGVRVIRAFGREKHEIDRFGEQNDRYLSVWLGLNRFMGCFWNLGDLISALQIMAVLCFGTVLCVQGSLTEGDLIAFVSYNTMLIWPVRQLGRTISELSKAGVAIDRIREVMNTEIERESDSGTVPDGPWDIAFQHVSFAYGEGEEVLHDLSFTVPAGTTLGILGGTGSGKSTLVHLLTRLYEPTAGQITANGVPLCEIPRKTVRKQVGIVLQEPFLFSRTLGENIAVTQDHMDRATLRDAIENACLSQTVEKFAQGLDTVVGERGVTLSGGQKQRVAIARLLTQNSPIMIFDDSLSAVDTETDARIRASLATHRGKSTLVLISHRIDTIRSADTILVLDRGRICEMGTHAELMEKQGIYHAVFQLQQKPEEVTA